MGVKIFKCQKSSSKSTRLPLSDQIPSPHPITSLEPTNLPSYRKNGKNEKNIAHRKRESSRSVDFSRTLTPKIEILNGNILFDEILGEKSHVTKEEYIHEIAP